MLHLGDLKKAGAAAPSARRGRDAQGVADWPARFAGLAATARDARLQAFYAAGAVAGETALKDVPMVAIDVETTGLDPARDEIVSIGLVGVMGISWWRQKQWPWLTLIVILVFIGEGYPSEAVRRVVGSGLEAVLMWLLYLTTVRFWLPPAQK